VQINMQVLVRAETSAVSVWKHAEDQPEEGAKATKDLRKTFEFFVPLCGFGFPSGGTDLARF
jgi:hypothetical protein